MYDDGIRDYIEVGAGNVLQGLVKKILNDKPADKMRIRGIDKLDDILAFSAI